MRRFLVIGVPCLLGWLIGSMGRAAEDFAWDLWRELPVQNGGRQKPLDTLGWETLRTLANRASVTDPQTQKPLDPTALYLTMLFDWQGWDHRDKDQLQLMMDWHPLYFHLHQPDKWDQAPLLRVDFLSLREALQLEKGDNSVSPAFLATVKLEDAVGERSVPFSAWADELLKREEAGDELTQLEKKGLELANRYWSYQNHRMGRTMELIPLPGSEKNQWMPLANLILVKFDDETDPTGDLQKAQKLFVQARESFRKKDVANFNSHTREFIATMRKLGSQMAGYPSSTIVRLEVVYNHWAPLRFAWSLMFSSAIGMLLHFGSRWKSFHIGSIVAYVAALIALAIGFGLRIAISGRPPVTNMYESVVYVGLGVAFLGLIFEWIYRRKYIITAAASVSTVVLLLADSFPMVLDPSVRPLEPVLRSNFWLVTHVMTITLSYAALALALGIANITLGYYLVGSENETAINYLSRFTYKAVQVGVLLLAAGVILGGVWADYSWGRFWGWDPKEVWALVALLGYLAVLHARFAGWVGHRGLAALSVVCFSLVVMAWYGVNFVLGAGLHSYGFGGGGQGYVYSAVVVQWLYVLAALVRSGKYERENSLGQSSDACLSPSKPRAC